MLKFQDNNTTVIATFKDFILTTYIVGSRGLKTVESRERA